MTEQRPGYIKFETTMHHKQNLRRQIDPHLIDQIEIHETPSNNYKKVYQNLCQDELEKSLILHENKKNSQRIQQTASTMAAGNRKQIEGVYSCTTPTNLQGSLNYRDVPYEDYELHKETKALDFTNKNFDGGKAFYKSNEQRQVRVITELEKMRSTLLQQMLTKQKQKQMQKNCKNAEQRAMREKKQQQTLQDNASKYAQKVEHQHHRNQIKGQIEAERVKRGRRSLFNYSKCERHNPITNPIEYHIENPYILKQIQNQVYR